MQKSKRSKAINFIVNDKNQTCKSGFPVSAWWCWGQLDKQQQYNIKDRHSDPLEQQMGWQNLQYYQHQEEIIKDILCKQMKNHIIWREGNIPHF